ncbi:hypothetical protein H5411_33710 [Amycolatopsis echigonensis]|uniref:PABS domain-containing protein n=4 Tax=Pseudonocardiaceae TaxID=2070 RepID=A0A8E1W4X3_9PSEU|nr:hypothetical protein A4R43_29640 [Amycolatopsis albispora]MBB2504086.1 hypothetical protein [Amycolatopsis echigonensis]PXY16827.1 hypothetical protein BAY59_37890 [Prauserella coralliicola]PXY25623.1 hypothetical protein BA062_26145 [Prauserella flavalba]
MLKRLGVVAGLSAAVLVATAVPAFADGGWGFTDCSQYPNPGCELGAGKNPRPGTGNQGNGNGKPSNPGQTNPGTGQANANGDTIIGGNNNLAQCGYERSDYQGPPPGGAQPAAFHVPPKSGAVTAVPAVYRPQSAPATAQFAVAQPRFAQAQPPSGAWYVYKCTGPGFADALYRPPVWITDGQPGPVPLPSPAELAAQARNQLRLPTPKIKANPAGDQLVSLPTWLWLDRSSWGDVSATASVPGVSVTAVARPTSVTWSMGDGGSVTCTGPGSPFPAGGDPKSASPDCGYTYKTSSAGQRADAFPVTATVNWTVTWSGAGQGGTFPNMTTSASVAFRVAESQGIATG